MVEAVNNNSSIIKGTATAAVIGAGVSAGLEAGAQKLLLKYPKKLVYDNYCGKVKTLLNGKEKKELLQAGSQLRNAMKNKKEAFKPLFDFVKAGKMDWKGIAKSSAKAAAWIGGIYLAYQGIKALFTKNDK